MKKTQQPYHELQIGPWLISVHRPELKGRNGGHQGWMKNHFAITITHTGIDWDLYSDSFDDADYSRLFIEMPDYLDRAKWFADRLPDTIIDIIRQMIIAFVNQVIIPDNLTSCHQ